MPTQKRASIGILGQALLEDKCEGLAVIVEQVTHAAIHLFRRSDEKGPISETIRRFEELSYELDKTALNLKLGVKFDETILLEADRIMLSVMRNSGDDIVFKAEQRKLAGSGQDGKNVLDWLDAVELRVQEIIVEAYKYREENPKVEIDKLTDSLSTLADIIRESKEDMRLALNHTSYGGLEESGAA